MMIDQILIENYHPCYSLDSQIIEIMYDLNRTAQETGLSLVTLRRYIKQGRLTAKKIGRKYWVEKTGVDLIKAGQTLESPDPEKLMVKAVETNQNYGFGHQRADSFSRARELFQAQGQTDRAMEADRDCLIFSFHLAIKSGSRPDFYQQYGRFAPATVWPIPDGRQSENPSPSLIDRSVIDHAKTRIGQVKNPATRAVYADLVFVFGPKNQRPNYGQKAIDDYLRTSGLEVWAGFEPPVASHIIWDSLARALEIGLTLNQEALVEDVIGRVVARLEVLADRNNFGYPQLSVIRLILADYDRLKPPIVKRLNQLIERGVDYTGKIIKDELSLREFIKLKRYLADKQSNLDASRASRLELIDAYIRQAGSPELSDDPHSQYELLEAALREGQNLLGSTEIRNLKSQLETAGWGRLEATRVAVDQVPIEVPRQDLIDQFIGPDLDQSLRAVAGSGIVPGRAVAKQQAEQLARQSPLSFLVNHQIIDDQGLTTKTVPGSFAVTTEHIDQHLSRMIAVNGGLILDILFVELIRRGLDGSQLVAFLARGDVFKTKQLGLVAGAVHLYFQGHYGLFVAAIAPQFEGLLRQACRRVGIPISRYRQSGRSDMGSIYLSQILAELHASQVLSSDDYHYFQLVLCNQLGPNLRNLVAHGPIEARSG